MNRRLLLVALLLPPLAGCKSLKKIQDTVKGLLNPLVSQGMVLGVEAPDSNIIDLSKTPYKEGVGFTLFLADAKNANDMENAPVSGASVVLDANTSVDVPEVESGLYLLAPGDEGLSYTDGDGWSATITRDGGEDKEDEVSEASWELATGADMGEAVPGTHTANSDLTVSFPPGYHASIIVVMDATTGDVTFSNEPKSIKELYDFSTGDDEITDEVIPGTAFVNDNTAYAIGIAPVIHTTSDNLDNMNTALSKFMAGKMKFYGTVVGTPIPTN